MKAIIISIAISLLSIMAKGQNQSELNAKAKLEYEKIDKDLNQTYQKIVQNYKADTIFIKSMKDAQLLWIKFRDAQAKMKFPPYINSNESILPMCKYYYLIELTNSRVKELNQWLKGTEEGNVCAGSIKSK